MNDRVPTWPIHERTAYGSRRCGIGSRYVEVGARDDVVAPVLAAGVQAHQELDARFLEELEERDVAGQAVLVHVGRAAR